MYRTAIRIVFAIGLLLWACIGASALKFTGETGNKATFETLGNVGGVFEAGDATVTIVPARTQ